MKFCTEKLKNKIEALEEQNEGVKDKSWKNKDEARLIYKIVERYVKTDRLNLLYKLLTKEEKDCHFVYLEAQPETERKNEGNTHLDIAMGSIKLRKNTDGGIEYKLDTKEKSFLFAEAKWDSDISLGVKYCTIRNQLQRVIDNALYFCKNPNEVEKIFVTLITPEKYMKGRTRLYCYKYEEYKESCTSTKKENILFQELEEIKKELPWKNKNLDALLNENFKKLVLNWVSIEELVVALGTSGKDILEIYKNTM